MASLRLAMDAAFHDLELSSSQNLDGVARAVPGEAPPLTLVRASRTMRPQQLSFFHNAFPLGIVPCLSPPLEPANKDIGPFALHAFVPGPSGDDWWTGLVAQFRPKKLIANLKKEVTLGDEMELPTLKDVATHVLDKSLYALGLFTHLSLTPVTSLLFNVEKHGERKKARTRAILLHRFPDHDVTLEATSQELFMDGKGTYWEVPRSFSFNLSSLMSESGFRYRFGIHKNGGGQPEALNSTPANVPSALMPGICAQASFSFEKRRDIWREVEKDEDGEPAPHNSYDVRLKDPHAAISTIIGGTCAAWFGGSRSQDAVRRKSLGADLFGSICYTLQHGKFTNEFNDLTRIDACMNIRSAAAFLKGAAVLASNVINSRGGAAQELEPTASPTLNLIFQQQVVGPIIFRAESRLSLRSPATGKLTPSIEDIMYGLSYSFHLLQSGKILAWFSPSRKEAMVELRFFEF